MGRGVALTCRGRAGLRPVHILVASCTPQELCTGGWEYARAAGVCAGEAAADHGTRVRAADREPTARRPHVA